MKKWLDMNAVPLLLIFSGGIMVTYAERHGWADTKSYWQNLGAAGLVLLRVVARPQAQDGMAGTTLPDPLPAGSTMEAASKVTLPPTEQSEQKA